MYSTILLLAATGALVASTAHAQAPERALLSLVPTGHSTGGTSSATGHAQAHAAPRFDLTGQRALLGQVDNPVSLAPAGVTGVPIDGTGALLGKRLSAISRVPDGGALRSSFVAQVRGEITTNVSGEAEFGAVQAGEGTPPAFVVSLGVRGAQGAVLFTRVNRAPLGIGRYRITDRGDDPEEVLALVMTGPATSPSGAFRGQSGWLIVTAASDHLLSGRFHLDGVGFLASEPRSEDRPVSVTGSFSAIAAGT